MKTITVKVSPLLYECFSRIAEEEGESASEKAFELIRAHVGDYLKSIEIQTGSEGKNHSLADAFENLFKSLDRRIATRMLGINVWPWQGSEPKDFDAAVRNAKRRGRHRARKDGAA